jgi:Zn-dependent oligopeptidase
MKLISKQDLKEMKDGTAHAANTAHNLARDIRELTHTTVNTLDQVNQNVSKLCDNVESLSINNPQHESLTLKENSQRLIDKYHDDIVNNEYLPATFKGVILATPEFIGAANEAVDSFYTVRDKALHTSKDLITSGVSLATQDDDDNDDQIDNNNNNQNYQR